MRCATWGGRLLMRTPGFEKEEGGPRIQILDDQRASPNLGLNHWLPEEGRRRLTDARLCMTRARVLGAWSLGLGWGEELQAWDPVSQRL